MNDTPFDSSGAAQAATATSGPRDRRRRWLRGVGAGVRWIGLGLAIASLALLALSFVRYDGVEYRTGTLTKPTATDSFYHYVLHTTSALNARGLIALSWWDYESVGPSEESMAVWKSMEGMEYERVPMGQLRKRAWFSYDGVERWRFAGLGMESFTQGGTTGNAVFLPHWALIVVFGAPAAVRALGYRARRRRAGMCARCGYDRAGLSDERACPECGTLGA